MSVSYDPARVTVVDHPLVQHKLSILRDEKTGTKQFRDLVSELAVFEGYEATRDLPLEDVQVATPIREATCKQLAGRKLAIVPILRAGLGMVDGLLELMLATGGSATAALEYLRKQGVSDIRLLCIVAAPEGIKAVQDADPNVKIFACAVDEGLNENAYIVPGLGDAGDRIFGTL